MAWNEHIDVYNSSLCCQLVTDPKSTIWVHILNQPLYKMGVKQDEQNFSSFFAKFVAS